MAPLDTTDTPATQIVRITPPDLIEISAIQGAGHVSPFVGQVVKTSGIVTAVDFNGYYLQSPTGDGNDATSDAIFVRTGTGSSSPVAVGDLVEIEGEVQESIPGGAGTGNLSTTRIETPDATVISSGNPLPEAQVIGQSGRVPPDSTVISDDELPVNLQTDPGTFNPDTDGIDFFESLEAMRVTVEDPVAISSTNRFDETWVVANNGEDVSGRSNGLNDRGGLNLNADADGFGDLNPERVQIQYDSFFDLLPPGFVAPEITMGDDLSNVTGVVSYAFGNFEILVTESFEVETPSSNQREVTEISGDDNELTIASYNIFNVTANPDDGDADQIAQLAQQIVDNLGSPDIIALQEVQDDSGVTNDGTLSAENTLEAIVAAIEAAGGPTYSFTSAIVDEDGETGGVPGGNIRNAFLYNEDRVDVTAITTLEEAELTALGVDNPETFDGTRDPLLGQFTFNGVDVFLVNNHFTSRFGSTPIFGGPQPFVQAGEAEREAEALAINQVVDALQAQNGEARIVVLGDLNTFEFTDELAEDLTGQGSEQVLTNLLGLLEQDEAYSFVFQGNSQMLDHIFVNDLARIGAEFDIVHVNTDFPESEAASDHEPLLASLQIEPDAEFLVGDPGSDIVVGGSAGDLLILRDGDDLGAGGDGDDEIYGGGGSDSIFGGDGEDSLFGGLADDLAAGGRGIDWVEGLRGSDVLIGDLGNDSLFGGLNQDFLQGDEGADWLDGGLGNDTADGGRGEDWLFGRGGDDSLFGRGGNDVLEGGRDDDMLDGGLRDDTLFGGSGDDALQGGRGDDSLYGGLDRDALYGGIGADSVFGGGGDDSIEGGNGQDILAGGTGDDVLSGGSGLDRFVFTGDFGDDTITDFDANEDQIQVLSAATQNLQVSETSDGVVLSVATAGANGSVTLQGLTSGSMIDFV
ncbi:MAG: endonuclease/exonuclease/phosphatase family protein [Pseudomonadota bacterium]